MKSHSYRILALAAGAVLLVSVVAFKRYLPYTGMNLGPRQTPPVVLTMEDAYLVGLAHGSKAWSIKAKRVELSRDRSRTLVTGITDGKIYNAGKVALKVTAGKAAYSVYAGDLRLWDGILVEGNGGQRITGPGATWNSRQALLRSNGRVTYESKWSTVTAQSLTVDVRNREMLMRKVYMTTSVKEAEAALGREASPNAR